MKKIFVYFLVVALMVVLAVPSIGMAASGEDKVASFEKHLSGLDKSDVFVQKEIRKYNQLSKKQKERFVQLIHDQEVNKQVIFALHELKPGQSRSFADGEVIVQAESGSELGVSPNPSLISSDVSEYSWKGWYSWTMTFLGINVTTLKTTVYYTADGNNNVLRSNSCVNSHKNIDPLIVVTDGTSSHWKSGGYAYGNGPFTIYGTATMGFVSASVAVMVQSSPTYTTGWKESVN